LTNKGNIEVSLTPLEGNAELYVNPGFYLPDLSKSTFQTLSKAKKRIIIPESALATLTKNNVKSL
jgi:hypothetical protein